MLLWIGRAGDYAVGLPAAPHDEVAEAAAAASAAGPPAEWPGRRVAHPRRGPQLRRGEPPGWRGSGRPSAGHDEAAVHDGRAADEAVPRAHHRRSRPRYLQST